MEREKGKMLTFGGLITASEHRISKSGRPWGFFALEDHHFVLVVPEVLQRREQRFRILRPIKQVAEHQDERSSRGGFGDLVQRVYRAGLPRLAGFCQQALQLVKQHAVMGS